MSNELPQGWVTTKFTELLDVNGGTQPPKSEFISEPSEGYIRLLQIRDFGSKPVPTYIPDNGKRRTCNKEDILIGRYGASVGRICTGMEGAYNVALAKVVKPDQINSGYLKYFLKSELFQQPLSLLSRSAQDGFNKQDLSEFDLLIPPENEQIRIADKLDSVLAKVDAAQARLEKIPTLLKRFRQSVLAAATSGELTREWREGKTLVLSQNEISKAYREGWILETLQDFAIKGKSAKSDSWKEKIPNLYLPSEEDYERFGTFPESWTFVSLDQVTRFVKDGPHFSPEYTEDGVPFISGRNVTQNGIDFATCKFISTELHDELSKRCKPVKGDILYTKGGTTGIACVNKLDKEFNVWVHVAVLRVSNEDVIVPDFIALVLNSPKCYERSQYYTHGVANRDLGLKRMIKICFAVPHIEEQKEIVRRVESLFTLADTVEKQYLAAKKRIDRLTQSLLAKAFRGELVPQDPNDEPAAELLKRIQAERNAQPPVKNKRAKSA